MARTKRKVNPILPAPALEPETAAAFHVAGYVRLSIEDSGKSDLRHSYAVAAIKSGDDIKTVQENLGHATAAFTLDVYGHVTAQMRQESASRMEQFIQSVSVG